VRACLSYSFGADREALGGLAYYYEKEHGPQELDALVEGALCPGTTEKDGRTVVSEPSAPSKVVHHTPGGLQLDSDTYALGLPADWGDNEVHTWTIGRSSADFATLKMDRGYSESRVPRYEERRVIHPKKHLQLRFPSLASATFRQEMEQYEYARPSIRVRVEACECLAQDGCDSYESPRHAGMPQCTFLGTVETTPTGGFHVSCETLPEINGIPQPTACSFTGGGLDVVFTVTKCRQD
jgi:hypothetical protein